MGLPGLPAYIRELNVCLSGLSLKFLRDGSVNVGRLSNTAADFCSSVRLLHSSVGVGFVARLSGLPEFSVLVDAKSATLTKRRWWIGLESNQLPAVDFVPHSPVLPTHTSPVCPGCQASIRFVNVCVLFPRRHRGFHPERRYYYEKTQLTGKPLTAKRSKQDF